ncbi:winged helix-turn-helix domain-containing protein [Streptomyces luteogriseus]|uniref:winged helix-turn-helix domain-containing protein n=1 Tax=Streptomyces luteogriseus TaxID=68233 RepID=UPI0037901F39
MTALTETPAERIAGDLALAIHQRLIRPGERLPSQSKLMAAYGVSMGTASAALGRLVSAGLIRTVPGSGTFAARPNPFEPNPVLDVLAAASLCRSLAARSFGPGSAPVLEIQVGGEVDTSGDREGPLTRLVDVSALEGLDRRVLRWMSEALLSAARRLVADGPCEGDTHVIATARAILRDGGRRPEGQPGIAVHGGPRPTDEDVALRIWPERAKSADQDGRRSRPRGPPRNRITNHVQEDDLMTEQHDRWRALTVRRPDDVPAATPLRRRFLWWVLRHSRQGYCFSAVDMDR